MLAGKEGCHMPAKRKTKRTAEQEAERLRALKVPVSERAIVQRLGRVLKEKRQKLKKCRSNRWRDTLGDYYLVDEYKNLILQMRVDLEELGRELGVLGHLEKVVMDDEAEGGAT
jgi:hypothetical protein